MHRFIVLTLVLSCPMTSFALAIDDDANDFRDHATRGQGTIFSTLDLPAPNGSRTASGAPGPEYWQQQADYIIEANLDVETYEVTGSAIITYTNNSPDPLDYLWLHLEQNIFRADSIGAKIASNASISMNRPHGDGYTIQRVQVNGGDLDFSVFDTMGRLDLPAPLGPNGGAITFEIDWSFTIPDRVFRRFGIEQVEQGTIFELAQWFPCMAVYDDVHGWNTHPYLGTGEFYTNFGDYDVRLTVPRDHLLVATGVLQNPEDVFTRPQLEQWREAHTSDDTVVIRSAEEVDDPASRPEGEGALTWHFKAEDVRTFAWATSDAFIYDAAGLAGVLVQSVYPKEAVPLWEKSTQMLRTAIKGYNERWFEYPYPVATNVNGPEGGMEYPMIIFCRGRTSERGLYGVTTHEIGHNWFPMVVNTDERRHAWMDEGFNTFINYYSFGDWFPGEMGRRGSAAEFAENMQDPRTVPVETPADQIPRGLLGRLEYAKPAVGLVLLREQILGPDRFDFAFRTYIRRWAFKSPRPSDFFRCMDDAAGADLAWFWRGWFLETSWLDQGIDSVEFDESAQRASVTFTNQGELVMPVHYKVVYEDGSEEHRRLPVEVWFSTNRITDSWIIGRHIREVVLDPDRVFPDVDRENNTWPAGEVE